MKKIGLAVLCAMLLSMSTGQSLSRMDCVLGGIAPGCTWLYALSVYGKPAFTDVYRFGRRPLQMQCYSAGQGKDYALVCFTVDAWSGMVCSVLAFGHSDFVLPSGIRCGATVEAVEQIYGVPSPAPYTKYADHMLVYKVKDSSYVLVFAIQKGYVAAINVGNLFYYDKEPMDVLREI